jgi:hypothetical protein
MSNTVILCDAQALSINTDSKNTDTHRNTQMLISFIKKWLSQPHQSSLEQFIASKHPKSAADVEHWEREFNNKISQGKLL